MTRPWEEAPLRQWEAQQPLYPRTVSISRPNVNDAPGARGYAGVTKADEAPIAAGLPASIQLLGKGAAPDGKVASDAYGMSKFAIFIPSSAAAKGLIAERDIATDEIGKRYQVVTAYWDSLGYNLMTTLLEA